MKKRAICISDLASYNECCHYWEWIELPIDKESLKERIQEILEKGKEICIRENGYTDSLHEEYFISDHENLPFDISEYSNPYKINEKLEDFEYLVRDETDEKVFELLKENWSYEEAIEILKEDKVIEFAEVFSEGDLARRVLESAGDLDKLPSWLHPDNIDYEAIFRSWNFGPFTYLVGDGFGVEVLP
jgi:hypothetical protein